MIVLFFKTIIHALAALSLGILHSIFVQRLNYFHTLYTRVTHKNIHWQRKLAQSATYRNGTFCELASHVLATVMSNKMQLINCQHRIIGKLKSTAK